MMPPNPNMAEYEHGQGMRLRAARETAGLTVAEVAARLKMPMRTIEALEAEDWARIGAPVFIRGQLRSYARLLGLPVEPIQMASDVAPIEPTRLVSRTRTPPLQRIVDQVGGRLVYVVITVLMIGLPVWMATHSRLDSEPVAASLDAPAAKFASDRQQPAVPVRVEPSAVMASMASLPQRPAPALSLRFDDDSWVQIVAPDGHTIEQALLKAGETRTYAAGEVGHMVLGNANRVEVQRNGAVQDLSPYLRANVARFTVSSEGSLAPVSD